MRWEIGLIDAIISGGFFVFLEFLIKRHDRKKAAEIDPEVIKNLILSAAAMIQDSIVQISREHIRRGEISVEDKEDLREIADPYLKAGFNHRGKEYWHAVDQLPVVEKYDEQK